MHSKNAVDTQGQRLKTWTSGNTVINQSNQPFDWLWFYPELMPLPGVKFWETVPQCAISNIMPEARPHNYVL